MGVEQLQRLVTDLPVVPSPLPAQRRLMAQWCVPDDEILQSPVLESLVTHLDRAFTRLFNQAFPSISDMGPRDFFGRDLAWDIAKNVDIISQPSDFGVILAGESITGQFKCLFEAFEVWQSEQPTESILATACRRREAANRAASHTSAPLSVEGAHIAKARLEAEKRALKESRDLERLQAAQRKEAERSQCASEKSQAAERKKEARELAVAAKAQKAAELLAKRDATGKGRQVPSLKRTAPGPAGDNGAAVPPKRLAFTETFGKMAGDRVVGFATKCAAA
ncbi:uncharacterized protein MELLADRAFT_113066 [Melampsora larici-populina 98AG31]|uniref:Uncharacterized protein n=1 Tax=Melampsora larici-populina (strain 98AG31 / pathotype 3-4-7) TaxID=747676 RepID=F4S8H5_MELLP|nr:uncharacterized protein MELLADRAFT_113066 [Melampsora larici-populina 98AG31]EGF99038.1 hypothetical protein MELLADRAFT_113066 [Melampsora larici-populina 98AG31]